MDRTATNIDEPSLEEVAAGWGQALQAFSCSGCQLAFLTAASARVSAQCPWCGQVGQLSRSAPTLRKEPPELVVPFVIREDDAIRRLSSRLEKIPAWLRPAGLTAAALRSRMRAVFVPMWLVDSRVSAAWSCEVGFDYEVKSHREIMVQGAWKSVEHNRTRVDWEPRAGTLERTFDNVEAPALSQHDIIVHSLGAFDAHQEQAWNAALLRDAMVMVPNLSPDEAWTEAREALVKEASDVVASACGAQHIGQISFNETHAGQNWTLKLLPIWTTSYKSDDGTTHILRVHGQRGGMSGLLKPSRQKAQRAAMTLGAAAAAALGIGLLGTGLPGVARAGLLLAGALCTAFALWPLRRAKEWVRLGD